MTKERQKTSCLVVRSNVVEFWTICDGLVHNWWLNLSIFCWFFFCFKDQFLPSCSGCHVVHLVLMVKGKDCLPINQGCVSGKDKNKEIEFLSWRNHWCWKT